MGKIVKVITDTGVIRALAIEGKDIVERARQIHGTSPTTSAALGRALLGASLMGSMLKSEEESITLRIAGGGPAGKILVCAEEDGNVRGFVEHPEVDLPRRSDGKLDVGGAVGTNGFVSVSKSMGTREPYIGQTPIVSGEIAEDITNYYAASEQTGTVCALGVLIDTDCSVKAAGGYIIQLLPNVYAEEITRLEENMKTVESVTSMLSKGYTPLDMVSEALKGFTVELLEEREVSYECRCSADRVKKALISLGKGELYKLAVELHDKGESQIEVGCEFCDKKYHAWFDSGEVIVN